MNVSKAERVITHFGQHPRLVGGVDVTVVIENDRTDCGAGRTLEVDVAGRKGRKDTPEEELRVGLSEVPSAAVHVHDVVERLEIEAEKLSDAVGRRLRRFGSKAEWAERSQKNRAESLSEIFVDHVMAARQSAARR